MPLFHIAFYRFVAIADADAFADRMRTLTQGLTGSVLVAEEGINGVLAGPALALDAFEASLDPSFTRSHGPKRRYELTRWRRAGRRRRGIGARLSRAGASRIAISPGIGDPAPR